MTTHAESAPAPAAPLKTRTASLIIFAVAVALVAPFFFAGRTTSGAPGLLPLPTTHDMAQHVSVLLQFDDAIRDGALYPRWQADFNHGYGLPWLNFYPPGFYYFAEGFFLVLRDVRWALFAVSLVFMAASGVMCFAFCRSFASAGASVAGALFFMASPYHLLDLYSRGALPELTGFFFVAAVFYFARQVVERGGLSSIAALSLACGGYVLCHLPVAYFTMIAVLVYAALEAIRRRDWHLLMRSAAAVAWGLAISAVYWAVALREQEHVKDAFRQIFPYHESYLPRIGGDSFDALLNHSFFALGVALIAAIVVAGLASLERSKAASSDCGGWEAADVLAILAFFMVTPASIVIGRLIPSIESVFFAWRWLVVASFLISVCVAWAAHLATRRDQPERTRVMAAAVLAAALLMNGFTGWRVVAAARGTPNQHAPRARLEHGFVPGKAKDPSALPATDRAVLTPPAGWVVVAEWKQLRRIIDLEIQTDASLRLKTYRFRGWKARIDGGDVRIEADEFGAQLIPVPRGRHRVVVTFESQRTHVAAAIGSALATVAAIVAMMAGRLTRWRAGLQTRSRRQSLPATKP